MRFPFPLRLSAAFLTLIASMLLASLSGGPAPSGTYENCANCTADCDYEYAVCITKATTPQAESQCLYRHASCLRKCTDVVCVPR